MAIDSTALSRKPAAEGETAAVPQVRLKVHSSDSKPALYELGDGGFLVGSAPGCDLRLSGPDLPPLICLFSRHAGGASLRRLAQSTQVLVNGRAVASTYLHDADRVKIDSVEVVLNIASGTGTPSVTKDVLDRLRAVETAERELKLAREKFAVDQANWEQSHKERINSDSQQAADAGATAASLTQANSEPAAAVADRDAALQELTDARETLGRIRAEQDEQLRRERAKLEDDRAQLSRDRAEMDAVRDQVERECGQATKKCQEWALRLANKREAVRKVVRRIHEAERKLKTETAALDDARQEFALKQAEAAAHAEQLQRDKALLDEQHHLVAARAKEIQKKMVAQLAELEAREQRLAKEQAELAEGQKLHQADLLRLDRCQEQWEKKQKNLERHALTVDRRYEQLQRDSRELEEQAARVDASLAKLTADRQELEKSKAEHAETITKCDRRASALEAQQAMLATLRTRLERLRDELRSQEQALSKQQAELDAGETNLRERMQETSQLRSELTNERELIQSERARYEERRAKLDEAVAQFRSVRESLDTAEAGIRKRQEEQDAIAAAQAEQEGLLVARTRQLEESHAGLDGERQALEERTLALARSEQSLASLQEQVRRRLDEVTEQQRLVAQRDQQLADLASQTAASHQQGEQQLTAARADLAARTAALKDAEEKLARREDVQRVESARVQELNHTLASQRESLAAERSAWETERQSAAEAARRAKADLETGRADAATLLRQLPDLEANAGTTLDRLVRAREQLHGHLAEVHAYARQSREDLEGDRTQVATDLDRLRQREQALNASQDAHRLAVAAFRQQLIELRGFADEMRHGLVRDGDRLDRREAEVNEQAQVLATASTRLEEQAGHLEQRQQQVVAQRGEVNRHMGDMRNWYRKKLRDLSGVDFCATTERDDNAPLTLSTGNDALHAQPVAMSEISRNILSVTGELEPGDRQLGDLLRSLDLVDADTLTVLLLEARRQRRSLRQLLLAGNYLTLYQMALIEAGNLDALMLGPVRVVDRLASSPHVVAFRVFDPRHNREALLRHLAEAEMHDAVRPDEFRQRFAALAALTDTHVAATYEVLDIAGRPAVLQEWLKGLPSSEWSALAAAPGVWFRVLTQAATALRTAHAAGLAHGHLQANSFVMTYDGVVKLVGLGEPRWFASGPTEAEATATSDLAALGTIAATWASSLPAKKGPRAKPFPRDLQSVLDRLTPDTEANRYPSAAALLEDLEGKVNVPANSAAWERFLDHVRVESVDTALRRSA